MFTLISFWIIIAVLIICSLGIALDCHPDRSGPFSTIQDRPRLSCDLVPVLDYMPLSEG